MRPRALLPLLATLLAFSAAPGRTEPALAALLGEARDAEARFEVGRALELYLEAERLRPDDPDTLQKIAQQLSDLTLGTEDRAEKKSRAEKALAYARRAVALEPRDPVNVLSLAICYGKLGAYADTRARIEYSRLVKEEAERALALDPNYDWAHHVLGRWHHEVADLGAAARFFVRMAYGGLPPATRADAIRHLERAIELAPERVPHHVELGFAYLGDGRKRDARNRFEAALTLPSRELYDEPAKLRARAALKDL